MHYVSPTLLPALTDSEFVFDGGPAWSAERALDMAERHGGELRVRSALRELETAMEPAPMDWLRQRLVVLFTLFNATRSADPQAIAIWLAETARLLGDLPHDALAHSIDEAIRNSGHGFLPGIGEIRKIANPLVEARQHQIERLGQMVAALDDPVATAARGERRAEQERRMQAVADASFGAL